MSVLTHANRQWRQIQNRPLADPGINPGLVASGKAPDIERKLRLAHRWLANKMVALNTSSERPTPPAVTSCHFERGGEIIARFNPIDCNKEIAS